MRARLIVVASVAAASAAMASSSQQPPTPLSTTEFVAFRVDAERVIATLKVDDTVTPLKVDEDRLTQPAASFGYRYFAAPGSWRDRLPATVRSDTPWLVHAAPAQAFDAIPEGIVGGAAGCGEAVGILMRVGPPHAKAFAALPARYFVAEAASGGVRASESNAASPSPVAMLPSPALADAFTRTLEAVLSDLLTRELPAWRKEEDPVVVRMANSGTSDERAWVQERRRVEAALVAGRARLKYDVQAFRLAPATAPVYFVRAEWMVGSSQAFAASLWLRDAGNQAIEIIETNLRPAQWLRMWEFQGRLEREQLGLVLNVLDRDGDGWGEVLSSLTGYEGMTITLREYSPTGFQPTNISFSQGC